MKPARICIFLGAVVACLICERGPVRAQPTSADDGSTSETDEDEDDSVLVDDANSPWSQDVSAEDRSTARALLREGTRLYLIPLYAKAAEQYTAALRKWKHPGIYYNLALTQRNLGRESDALESLERALKYGERPLGPKRFRVAQKQLADLKRLLGRLRVTCRTPGAEVTLDGVTLFTGPGSYEGWVKAKSHELTAKKAGYLSQARRVTVSPDQPQEIELKLITLGEATDTSRRWAAWKPWVVAAAGGAIAAAGGGMHVLASRSFKSYDDQFLQLTCVTMPNPQAPGCTKEELGPDLTAQLDHARRQQAIAVGGYIAGGSLVAAGIVLLYLNRPRLAEEAPGSPTRSMAVVPTLTTDMLGVSVSVSH